MLLHHVAVVDIMAQKHFLPVGLYARQVRLDINSCLLQKHRRQERIAKHLRVKLIDKVFYTLWAIEVWQDHGPSGGR